jgi:hypothetical protein
MSERFAVLDHDWPEPHRDLFLERDGVLLAWRLPAHCNFHLPLSAVVTPNHRLLYLDYEGPVSGNRGVVSRWDTGSLVWLSVSNDELIMNLSGTRLSGHFQLKKCEGDVWWLGPKDPLRA